MILVTVGECVVNVEKINYAINVLDKYNYNHDDKDIIEDNIGLIHELLENYRDIIFKMKVLT
jgi:hypothetical protein